MLKFPVRNLASIRAGCWKGVHQHAALKQLKLDGRLGYFCCFFAHGRKGGSPRRQEGEGDRFLIEIPRRAEGVSRSGRGWGEGILGGGLNFFCRAEILTKKISGMIRFGKDLDFSIPFVAT